MKAAAKPHSTFSKAHLDDPRDFKENVLWADEIKVEHFGRLESRYMWHETNTAFYEKNIIPTVKYGGDGLHDLNDFP